jgi:predicted small lipoprotein YifL
MKLLNLPLRLGMLLCLSACGMYSPTYFGDKYTPTNEVQTFYSTKDIKQPFEVIGHMNAATGSSEYYQDKTRQLVIEKAKEIGGDGVVFSEINRETHQKTTDDFSIKVEVIKFK